MAIEVIQGNNLMIEAEGVPVGCSRTLSISRDTATIDATCKATGDYAASTPGQKSWTVSASGVNRFYTTPDAATNRGVDYFIAAWEAGTVMTLTFTDSTTGHQESTGEAFLTNVTVNANQNEESTYDLSFQGTGPLVTSVIA